MYAEGKEMQRVSTSYNAALPLGTFLYIIPLGGRCRPAIITETKRRISAHYQAKPLVLGR